LIDRGACTCGFAGEERDAGFVAEIFACQRHDPPQPIPKLERLRLARP
jgi:hypothetical protein